MFILVKGNAQDFYFIPTQIIKPYKLLGMDFYYSLDTAKASAKSNYQMTLDSLNISRQITFAEYKVYLEAIKKDSSYPFYKSQLPDSNITTAKNYEAYITDKKYENFPVMGIRWEAAMNYCKWKTLSENKVDDIKFVYLLPKVSQWLDAFNYLETNKIPNDFDKNYADWTSNVYFEGAYGVSSFPYDVIYYIRQNDKPRDKRKRVIGSSFLYANTTLLDDRSFYAFNGYRFIGFRIVKQYIKEDEREKKSYSSLFKYWGLPNTD